MKIRPTHFDFEKWFSCVPQDGDIIFLNDIYDALRNNESFVWLTREQAKAQSMSIWTLNCRSWYGYTLNHTNYCMWLPIGAIENLREELREYLHREQDRLNVPTIIEDDWLTSLKWSQLSFEERIHAMSCWTIKNEIQEYESVEFAILPKDLKNELKRIGYDKIINKFAEISGPNCFAAVAGAIVNENRESIYKQWMFWPSLEQTLKDNGFRVISTSSLQMGDVLVFVKDSQPIHAAYFLGNELYFEKTGQDFYEPYRIGQFQNWQLDWPNTNLVIWRRA